MAREGATAEIEEPVEVQQEGPKPLSVDLTEDPDEPAAGAKEQPEDRKARRQGYRELKDKLDAKDKDLGELRQKLAALEGRLSAPQPIVVPQREEADPSVAEVDELSDQLDAIAVALRATNDEATAARLTKTWRKLDARRRQIEIQQAVGERGEPQRPMTQDQIVGKILAGEYPAIYKDDGLRTQAQGLYMSMLRNGKTPGMATAREALERIAGQNGMGRKPAPSEDARAKHASTGARAGSTGGGQNYTPDKFTLRTAIAYCDTPSRRNLPDEEKVRIWHREVGKNL